MNSKIYQNYTSTSVKINEQTDMNSQINWVKDYITFHFENKFPAKGKNELRILEVGCGWGKYLKALSEMGYTQVEGSDLSPEQIKVASDKLGLTQVKVSDAMEHLRVSKHKFDVVLMLDLAEHLELEYLIDLLNEIRGKLNPGGIIIMQVPNGISPMSPITYADITHYRAFTVYSSAQVFKMAGFSNIQTYEMRPTGHSLKSKIRAMLWKFLVRPLILAYMLIANGETMGGVYTANLMTIAKVSD